MAAGSQLSSKRLAISKANARMVAIVAAATFISIFALVASKAMLSQVEFHARVASAKNQANNQLKQNIQAFSSLVNAYDNFDSARTNMIGGSLNGNGSNDGENAKIVLDALPSKYDFPALASSLEKLLTQNGYSIGSLSGTDQQTQYQSNPSSQNAQSNPQPISMPFSFSVNNANYQSIQHLSGLLLASIRPMVIDNMTISGGGGNMTLTVSAHTYFQAGKGVTITKEAVK